MFRMKINPTVLSWHIKVDWETVNSTFVCASTEHDYIRIFKVFQAELNSTVEKVSDCKHKNFSTTVLGSQDVNSLHCKPLTYFCWIWFCYIAILNTISIFNGLATGDILMISGNGWHPRWPTTYLSWRLSQIYGRCNFLMQVCIFNGNHFCDFWLWLIKGTRYPPYQNFEFANSPSSPVSVIVWDYCSTKPSVNVIIMWIPETYPRFINYGSG